MPKPVVTVVLLLLGLCSLRAQATGDYSLKLKIERNDIVVIDTVVEVESGHSADVQVRTGADRKNFAREFVHAERDSGASARIIANVKESEGNDAGDVAVDLKYFEKNHGRWITIAEPSIVAALGQDASIQSAPDENLKISVRVEKSVNSERSNDRS